jgi:hypothetical protein
MSLAQNQKNLYLLGKDKDIILETFMEDEDIVSLLIPEYNPLTATEDLDIILQDHIYDTIDIDNTQGKARAYICIEAYVPTVESDSIKEIGIVINVFCHDSLKKISSAEKVKFVSKGYFGNRIDMLIDAIDRCLNGKRGLGLGKLRLKPRNPIGLFKTTNQYYGKSMEYTVSDFNVIHNI